MTDEELLSDGRSEGLHREAVHSRDAHQHITSPPFLLKDDHIRAAQGWGVRLQRLVRGVRAIL